MTNAATALRDVVVTNEQSGEQWRAHAARIKKGRIVISATRTRLPPDGMLDRSHATFTIAAADLAHRSRIFLGLVYEPAESSPPRRYVFR